MKTPENKLKWKGKKLSWSGWKLRSAKPLKARTTTSWMFLKVVRALFLPYTISRVAKIILANSEAKYNRTNGTTTIFWIGSAAEYRWGNSLPTEIAFVMLRNFVAKLHGQKWGLEGSQLMRQIYYHSYLNLMVIKMNNIELIKNLNMEGSPQKKKARFSEFP